MDEEAIATGLTVRDLGERGVLERLQRFCPGDLVGDDAAVLSIASASPQSLAVTTDMLVEDVHFSERTTSAADVGWRAAAANLSDLAAMGARPWGVTVALAARSDTPVAWIEELYAGMSACLSAYGAQIWGGDLCRSPQRSLAIAAIGRADPDWVLRRDAARVGDAIVATGPHGLSRAGLELLLQPKSGASLNPEQRSRSIAAHQRPRPRADVLPLLRAIAPGRVAAMDSSDGLADAVVQICERSGVGARLTDVPIPAELAALTAEPLEWVLYGGEDFELVLCLPVAQARSLVAALPGAAIVGEVTDGDAVTVETDSRVLRCDRGGSFQHF